MPSYDEIVKKSLKDFLALDTLPSNNDIVHELFEKADHLSAEIPKWIEKVLGNQFKTGDWVEAALGQGMGECKTVADFIDYIQQKVEQSTGCKDHLLGTLDNSI